MIDLDNLGGELPPPTVELWCPECGVKIVFVVCEWCNGSGLNDDGEECYDCGGSGDMAVCGCGTF